MKRLFVLIAVAVFFVSCEKEADNVYSLELIDGKPVVTGSENGLMWYMDDPDNANTKLNMLTYAKAEEMCANMDYAGFTDWRLPTIDELRSMVTGFGDIETGGRCKVSSECLAMSCLYQGQKNDSDYPCANEELELLQGPGPKGCFFDEVWRTYCGKYWSSSKLKNYTPESTFQLDFSDPAILSALSGGSNNMGFARCVR